MGSTGREHWNCRVRGRYGNLVQCTLPRIFKSDPTEDSYYWGYETERAPRSFTGLPKGLSTLTIQHAYGVGDRIAYSYRKQYAGTRKVTQ